MRYYSIYRLLFYNSICRRYDEITDRITSKLSNTEELVELNQYMKHTSEVTVHKLRHEIEEAVKRLDFLLDYATLPGKFPLPNVCMQMLYLWQHHTTQLLIFHPAFHSQSLSVRLPSAFGAVWVLWEHFFFKTP